MKHSLKLVAALALPLLLTLASCSNDDDSSDGKNTEQQTTKVTVTYYGDTTSPTPRTVSVESGTVLSSSLAVVSEGYHFKAWISADGTDYTDKPISSDVTLFAYFEKVTVSNGTTTIETVSYQSEKTETVTKNPDGSTKTVTTEKTVDSDGSETTTTTTKDADGSETTTTTTKDADGNETTTTESKDTIFAGCTFKITKLTIDGSDVSHYIGTSGSAYYFEISFGTDGKSVTITEYDEGEITEESSTYSVSRDKKAIVIADDDAPLFAYSDDYKTLTATVTETEDDETEIIGLTLTRDDSTAPQKHTVTFRSNDGSEISAQTVEHGKTATAPAAPVRDGFIFVAWYSDSDFETAFDFSTAITENITLYAKWEEKKSDYEVTFNSNGGSAVASQNVTGGDKATEPDSPTKSGWRFVAWYSDAGFATVFDFSAPITESITLYAKWEEELPDEITVTIDEASAKIAALTKNTTVIVTGQAANSAAITGIQITKYVAHLDLSRITGVTALAEKAFKDVYLLKSIALPNTITTIGSNAFQGCVGLKAIILPDSLQTLGSSVFKSCTALTEIVLPATLTQGTHEAFNLFTDCTALTAITVADGNEIFKSIDDVLYSKDGSTLFAYPIAKEGEVFTVPTTVTTIANSAFENCVHVKTINMTDNLAQFGVQIFKNSSITSLEIPANVHSIYYNIFEDCSYLSEITVASGNTAFMAIDGVLYSKDATKLIKYPSAKSGTEFTVPETVTEIGYDAFRGSRLVSIVLKENVVSIGTYAFAYSSLQDIVIPASVTKIGHMAFYNSNLKTATFADTASKWYYTTSSLYTNGTEIGAMSETASENATTLMNTTYITKYLYKGTE